MHYDIAPWIIALGQMALLIALGPLVTGVIQKIKARFQCRCGAGIFQPYRDLFKLFSKSTVQADNSSAFFRVVPALVLGATCAAAMLVPVLFAPPTPGTVSLLPLGDALLLLGWLALARFLTAVAALDAGGAFGGMGTSREMTVATLVEPALIMVLFSVAVVAGTTDLGAIVGHSHRSFGAPDLLALFSMLILLLAETGRIPVDNPDTHLELTMLHEGMLLEHSGPGLGCLLLANHTKQIVLMAFVQALFFPFKAASTNPEALALGLVTFILGTLALSVFLSVVESAYAKLRFFNLPQFLSFSLLCAFLAVALRLL
ncbi:MAG: NADH-quinone oxidoreductase subunit H [Victivallales bacterium]